ncbi:PLP-dependent aspartate aminotransferase family protein [Thermosipho sp. (in: thermotogales)]|jgi:cystathionine gamma-lyase|uniref:trans-sulfuration enzyme family protein n=1 Tax=Thermosipho sp. (in: thermotogales) TaxID=1968895 RepID=UPI00257EFAB7|nr:PLP-dependent aspartate aminotransferase family protein [Thermosipho sp. (in: thermotogales)]MBZ4650899.1 cystathionine gamma-lyase [Thermosipho sp. (in: thermotogales)]MDK2906253.1 cystathionine gamma-lyase [Petrotoga sp.]
MKFPTRAIHVGEIPKEFQFGDAVSPIHLSTTYAKSHISQVEDGYVYSRSGNPTRDSLEKKFAALENAKYGLAFSSGLAAETTILLSLLNKGDHVIAFDDLYGGTKRLFNHVMKRFGIEFSYVDFRNIENIEKEIKETTKMIWIESPTNPLLKLADIKEISSLAKDKGIIVVVDNTFASPYFQNPLALGADIVLHSITKYISGHSDVVGGAIMLNNKDIYEKLKFHQNAVGAILDPFSSWLAMRGIKTLSARMEKHEKNAMEIAKYLENHPQVEKVYYPGLQSHPQHELAKKQMKGFSGILSFELKGGLEDAIKFVENLELFFLAESLGGVESLIELPALMTHSSIPREERIKVGIKDSLIRVSVGIEDINDLIEDLEKGFRAVKL